MGQANWRRSTTSIIIYIIITAVELIMIINYYCSQATLSGTRDTRRQRMTFDAINGEEYYPFGRSGGGAPLKTGSGKLQTSLKADPNIRFQTQLMKEVNDTLVSMIATLP